MHDDITFYDLIEKVRKYNDDEDELRIIEKAYNYAKEKHFTQKRITGDDYITHPLNVAYILTDVNADYKAICAALLHDTIEDSDGNFQEIEKLFGYDIANLVECVTKINRINFNSDSEQMAANQRKILVGLASDVRVLIIKLADRLHNMRTLYVFSPEKQQRKARETLEILTPVAHRLGMYKIKSELEDLCLRYLNPSAYFDILEKLNYKKTEMDEAVGKMLDEVSSLLKEHGIRHEIKGRSKSVYSIYNKLSKGRSFNDIYDILALRVLVDTEQECYLALGLIHSKYKPVPKRFKDYIAMPKSNFYQSLHTTVFGIDGMLFEIQIRTYDMDRVAEYGIASHWSYKEHTSGDSKDAMDQKLAIFRNIIELNEDSSTPEEFISSVKKDILFNDSIFVYTPKGDVIELPNGSTTVDFAYKVHSEVGDKMVGAIVNDNIVPFDYVLKTGDIIKINTSRLSNGPNKDWLNFVVTSQAKNKIKGFYSKIEKDDNINRGMVLLDGYLKKKNITFEMFQDKYLNKLFDNYKIKDIDEFYMSLGMGKYTIDNMIKSIVKEEEKKKKSITLKGISKKKQEVDSDILVENMSSIKVTISGCCKPIPGDNIIGYITKGAGITVHRSNCKNIMDLDERLINVKWNDNLNKKYPTDLLIYTNEDDILLDIITKASSNDVVIDSIFTLNKSSLKVLSVTVLVKNIDVLDKFCKDLYNIGSVVKIERQMF
ncbi:MAG: bifunctional (p)ppGpp synthetase/guanosine-3',5'-bis(diphosphate) 3'-pyrophosphohydrolase [Bacilli bacterium]|nr:bifunctional (p)ppGpp synthetase/guanosine-3',5'-bis(diphosphate) 3'-pyrophosphohydrolase [Clostridium sp.]MDY3798487.1 bifunctional (p)ppGpp synthetase/guanosine-3',5'-bis(diphosphate) 3'-pyrophosphohydrolase [Bacilli bacterium]